MPESVARTTVSCRRERLIIFTRFPEPGVAKTRLIPALGAEGACEVHQALTRRTLDVATRWRTVRQSDVEIRFTGGDPASLQNLFGPTPFDYRSQSGGDLGERLSDAIKDAFQDGAERIVVIGTDCPEIDQKTLDDAFDALQRCDVVVGPAADGGYYLIGLQTEQPDLFRDMPWGSDRVLRSTLERGRQSGKTIHQLAMLPDVDYPEDLITCRRVGMTCSNALPGTIAGLISVVVPTLNEAPRLEQSLSSILGMSGMEVIVADGGSSDQTVEIARRLGASVVCARRGRGPQMNAGAAMSRGEVLLFLHADSQLPTGFREIILSILKSGAIAGAFRLKIDGNGIGLRLVEWGTNLRSRMFRRPYGDQGLFVRAADFFNVRGFPNWPLMEDYELCRRLRRRGQIKLATASVTTSARRWQRRGILRTTLTNQLCVAAFHFGVSPTAIADYLYYGRHTSG